MARRWAEDAGVRKGGERGRHLTTPFFHTLVNCKRVSLPACLAPTKAADFDHLFERLRSVAAALHDWRTGDNTRYRVTDIAPGVVVMFFALPF